MGDLQEVFYYITFDCNLRCRHCYVGDKLAAYTHAGFDLLALNLRQCYQMGVRKITFLGGEPTLYPDYDQALDTAAEIGYSRIVVDTNGTALDPMPRRRDYINRLAIRFGFEGAGPETHDRIRGKGTFARSMRTLQSVVAEGVRVQVTLTLNALNVSEIQQMIKRFARERVNEINFHFMSPLGNGRLEPRLRLTAGAILRAQEQLESLQMQNEIPLRYPRFLVHRAELYSALVSGYECRLFSGRALLILPQGEMYRCPLQIAPGASVPLVAPKPAPDAGCPLADRFSLGDLPSDYVVTCVSWKKEMRL